MLVVVVSVAVSLLLIASLFVLVIVVGVVALLLSVIALSFSTFATMSSAAVPSFVVVSVAGAAVSSFFSAEETAVSSLLRLVVVVALQKKCHPEVKFCRALPCFDFLGLGLANRPENAFRNPKRVQTQDLLAKKAILIKFVGFQMQMSCSIFNMRFENKTCMCLKA